MSGLSGGRSVTPKSYFPIIMHATLYKRQIGFDPILLELMIQCKTFLIINLITLIIRFGCLLWKALSSWNNFNIQQVATDVSTFSFFMSIPSGLGSGLLFQSKHVLWWYYAPAEPFSLRLFTFDWQKKLHSWRTSTSHVERWEMSRCNINFQR